MTRGGLGLFGLLAAAVASAAFAQQGQSPEPMLRAAIAPANVVVGQRATLHVVVLAPNYMPKPPMLPDFQLRNAVTRSLGAVNLVEQHDGTTYAGVQYDFAIYPQEPGSYTIADQKITVTYADEPPKSREVTLAVPRLSLKSFIPEGARELDPFVAASGLTLTQVIDRSSPDLKVGDSISRTVTMKAEGTPAMLLPPPELARPRGLAVYPDQPVLADDLDRRTGALSATRTDKATYILQTAGDYTLPPIEIEWWSVDEQKIQHAHVDAATFHVAEDPALRSGGADGLRVPDVRGIIDWLLAHWRVAAVGLAMLCALAWLLPPGIGALRGWLRKRRVDYLASEAASFVRLRTVAARNDPKATYFALLEWIGRFAPLAPDHSVRCLSRQAHDAVLDREISSIEARLFGPEPAGAWSADELVRRLKITRRRLSRPAGRWRRLSPLPPLNPVQAKP